MTKYLPTTVWTRPVSPAAKAQRLSDHPGFTTTVTRPMTIAEITGQGEADYEAKPQRQVIGFRRNSEQGSEMMLKS